jgi:hemin uptake protein HemP
VTQPQPGRGSTPPQENSRTLSKPAARLESQSLLRGKREVVIVHQGEEYRLRITRLDKLILTK